MPDRAPKVRRGEPRRASTFNRLRDFAASKLRLEVEPPLTLKPEGSGRVLSADQDRSLFVQLSGASSPYSMAQVRRRTSTHSWVTVAGGVACTACAYNLAGGTGLAGKVVEAWPGVGADDWLFQYNRYKPPCTSSLCVKVIGCCNLALPGATATIKQGGVTIGSGTTGADGKFCLGGLAAGTYDYQATKATFSGTPSGTITLAGCNIYNATLTLTTPADAAHVCTCCCPDPMPTPLSMSDNDGTHALAWDTSALATEGGVWFGVHTHTFPSGYTAGPYGGCVFGGAVTGWLAWVVRSFGGNCLATLYYPICQDGQVGPTDTVAAPANMAALRSMITFYPYQALADGYSGFTAAVGGFNCVLTCAPSACYYRAAAGAPGFAGSLATLST